MTDWEPATEAEAAMRDALRANDQELYFRILARIELLLPVPAEALAGQASTGWGTWTTGGRTHVLAFTSPAALRACLGENSTPSRRSAYADLAGDWPNHEWWLAVNPGLPIEGYLPAWFVSQLSRGDVRLPGRTIGARARLERAETAARARASAAVPGWDAREPGAPESSPAEAAQHDLAQHDLAQRNPAQHDPAQRNPAQPPPTGPAPGPTVASAAPVSPGAAGARTVSRPVNPPYRRPAEAGPGSPVPPYGDGQGAAPGPRPGPAEVGPGRPADGRGVSPPAEPAASGSAWLSVPRRRPLAELSPSGPTAEPADRPANPPASFFEPASSRNRAARPVGEPHRPADRAVPPARFAGVSQSFPRRTAPDQVGEQATPTVRPAGPEVEPPTVAFPPAAVESRTVAFPAGPAESPTVAFSPGLAESSTVAFSPGPAESPTVAFSPGLAESPTVAFSPGLAEPSQATPGPADGAARSPRPGAAAEPPRPAFDEEATRAFRPVTPARPVVPSGGTAGEEAGRPTGTRDELPRRRPVSGLAQAFPSSRSAPGDARATEPRPASGERREELAPSAAEPVSGPPASRRSFSPIVIEGTVIESRELPAVDPVPEGAVPPASSAAGPSAQAAAGPGTSAAAGPSGPAAPGRTTLPADAVARPAPEQPASTAPAESGPGGRTPPAAPAEDLFRPAPRSSAAPADELFRPATSAADVPPAIVDPAPERVAPPAAPPAPERVAPPAPEPVAPPAPEFRPANEVEENLLVAAGAGSTDSFLSTLLLARVLLPVAWDSAPDSGPGDPGFVWRTEQLDGDTYVVVYTSPERMADHLDDPVETVRVRFVQLIRRWPDAAWSFAVNPNTPVGAKLPGEQIVALANWAAEVGLGDDAGSEPEPVPTAGGRPANAPRPAPPPADPNRPVVMQKVISPSQLSYYLERGYDRVSGFVHRASELAHLNTPAQLYGALGLGYPGSPFSRDAEEIHVLRWPAYRPSLYRIPYGGQNEAAMRAMEGWVIERPPFRGNGFAPGESSDIVAEFKVDSARLPHGAQLCRIGADGTERTIAVLDTDALHWRRVEEA
ncbi:SseB family protein [Micromonospora sp. B11E3]|uniref:SseB family protein n=1 Tax=Micromonospora sp. B11E3 TaxID=3153562 RepID=UPI00325E262A